MDSVSNIFLNMLILYLLKYILFCLKVNPETGYIDYDRLQENARLFHPKLIIAGF